MITSQLSLGVMEQILHLDHRSMDQLAEQLKKEAAERRRAARSAVLTLARLAPMDELTPEEVKAASEEGRD